VLNLTSFLSPFVDFANEEVKDVLVLWQPDHNPFPPVLKLFAVSKASLVLELFRVSRYFKQRYYVAVDLFFLSLDPFLLCFLEF